MAQPEPPEQEKKQQEKIVSDDKENAAGGKSGSVLPDLSGNRHRACKILTLI